jgi:hypothetical protein
MTIKEIVCIINSNLPLIALFSSIFAALAAGAAWKNTAIARRAQKNQRLNMMLDYRYSDENFNAKKELKYWYKKCSAKDIGEKFVEIRSTDEGKRLDSYRNTFFIYYQKIYDLYKAKLLKKDEIKVLVNASDLNLLFFDEKPIQDSVDETIEIIPIPKELEVKNGSIFKFYKNLYFDGFIDGIKHNKG